MILPTQIGLIVILAAAAVVAGGKYLAEKPDYLTPCLLSDPAFNKCYAKNFQVLFSEWRHGIPGLKSIGTIDPLHVKRITIADDGTGAVSINIEMTSIVIEGFADTIVEDASFDREKLLTTLNVHIPKLKIGADYALKGHVLAFNLDGHGKTNIITDNFKLEIRIRVKPRYEDGILFLDIDRLRVKIKDVAGFHIELENLFNGQRDLEESAHTLLNENWRDFFPALRPSITAAIQTVMEDRNRKIFAYLPTAYFIGDISGQV